MKRNRFWALLLVLAMIISLFATIPVSAAEPEEEVKNDNLLRLWYDEPATDWETEALAIGNGYMGAMVFGGVGNDKIHLNEKTIWNGGPSENNPNYNYGNTNPTETKEDLNKIKSDLEAIREKLDDKSEFVFGFDEDTYQDSGTNTMGEAMNWLNNLMGDLNGYDAPADYANIYLDFSKSGMTDQNVTNYVRDLDMRTALATVSYDYDGVHYTREYFNSYPDNVLVIRLDADKDGMLTFDAQLSHTYYVSTDSTVAEGDTITGRAHLSNGLQIEGELKVLNEGGEITANDNGTISVTNADTVTLIFACGTDYAMKYPDFRTGVDPHEAVAGRVEAAAEKGYEAIKEDHLADYTELFSRLELGFNEEIPQIPTDDLLQKYRNMVDGVGDPSEYPTEGEQRALEIICYQMGRYLTIAGSREGSLPTNLQGVWGEGGFTWYGDYHFNINIQMNYWPTMAANLAECHLPYNDFLEALRVAGRQGAASAFGIKSEEGEENGWLVGCFSTPYMFASMGQDNNAAGWNPAGSAWALQNLYEYYLFTSDVEYLRDHIYPSMKEVANFWNEALWWSDYQQRYVSAPSYSPENGPIVNGASYDQQLIWQHFENTIQATNILIEAGYLDANDPEVQENLTKWADKQSKMDPVLVGEDGQVKEWFEETSFGKAQAGELEEIDIPRWRASLGAGEVAHRHVSHLMGLYPGTLISKDNDEYMDAAMVTLNERGLAGSGWAKGHKLNLWARTGHAAETFEMVQSAVGGGNSGFLDNLFSSHGGGYNYKAYPIFQIDGNYGYTAGINEMLIQSQLGYVQFLPTIPEEWNTGFVDGIVARGNFEIDMKWTDGKADSFKVTSRAGGEFIGEYEDLSNFSVTDSNGKNVPVQVLADNKISFETEKSETYTLKPDDGSSSGGGSGGGSAVGGNVFNITVTQADGGKISPASASVRKGANATFTITANDGYVIKDVLVDGKSVGAVATYTFSNVTAAHRITAVFAAEGASEGFTDVASDAWYAESVNWAQENGLMNGTSATSFSPDGTTTRGMIVTILYRMEGSPEISEPAAFSDVAEGQYYADAIAWASANEIVNGYGEDKFGPNDAITREQMAAILYRYAEYKQYDVTASAELTAFADADTVSTYAQTAMKWAVAEELINGVTADTLSPRGNASRAQVAAILMRFSESVAK